MTSTVTNELRELFKKNIVMDIDDLQKHTSSSRITVLRHLKEIGYITSYNKNAKYYTLLEFANFDETGIFNHKGILFFKNGGIRELVIKEIVFAWLTHFDPPFFPFPPPKIISTERLIYMNIY